MHICPKCHLEYYEEEAVCAVDGHALERVDDSRIGKLVGGRYILDSVLGEGGMATVFRAHHTLINRVVAVKLLHPYIAKDKRTCERFAREARSAAAIAHPNVIEIFDFGKMDDGVPYLVMELLEGSALRKLVENGPMPLDLAVEISIQLLRGLARAHDLGVAHRDVKPENAFVQRREDGTVVAKLVDFGIALAKGDARLTDIDTIVGTPQYVAPERLSGTESGVPADLYSFGVMLFEMVTGKLPFEAEGLPGWILQHLETVPPRPSSLREEVPPPLDRLILELLAKDPKDRPVDARAVIGALERLRPEVAGPELIPEPSAPVVASAPSSAPSVEEASASGAVVVPPADAGEEQPASAPPAGRASSAPFVAEHVRAEAAPATPESGRRTQSLTIERWHHRAAIIQQMLERAFPGDTAPPELLRIVEDVDRALGRMTALRDARVLEQNRLSEIELSSRESRERLGHAVHALGEVLSRVRSDLREAEATADRKRAEAVDLEYQLGTLREKLAEDEMTTLEAREALDVALAESGEEIERLRREVGTKTLAVLTRVRHEPTVRPLLAQLEEAQHA